MQLKKFLLFGLFAAVLPAFAEETADRKTATSLKYVEHELGTRQNKFTAEQNKAMEYTDSAGDVQKRTVKSDLGSDTTDTSLPMVGGVNTKLATKQDDIDPINDHTAVTYTGQSGSIGAKGIYQTTESYAAQSDNLIDAKTFNAALKRGLDSEFLCSEYKPGTDLCWVWSIHNNEAPAEACPNLLSAAAAGTVTQDGITVVSDGHGIYTITGTATRQTEIYFNVPEFTIPTSVGHGGTGAIYFGNSAIYDGVYFIFGRNNNAVDSWTLSNVLDRFVTQYSNLENRTVNQIGFRLPAGQTYNMTMRPAVYNDGRTSAGTFVSCQSLVDIPYTTLVPAGYTPVEFLETSSRVADAYIDTGINFNSTYTYEIEFMKSGIANGIMGARVSPGYAAKGNFALTYQNTTAVYSSTNNASTAVNFNDTLNVKHTMKYQQSSETLLFDNQDFWQSTWINSVEIPYNIYLFGFNSAGSPGGSRTGFVRIYSYIVKNSESSLVQQLIPARRNRDNVLGMYDTVNNVFKTNAATSGNDFTAGPDINNIIYVPQNQ